jgi:hypothetical protein
MDEKIAEAIEKIDYILDYKFITDPVRADLLQSKQHYKAFQEIASGSWLG